MNSVECIVIGAGVVGLAIARKLSMQGHEVVILEAADTIGTETSSRNSEVIHAGIYYPKNSLKAKFCVEGKQILYEYCRSHAVPYKNTGKLIVATEEDELVVLENIRAKAIDNGVTDLKFLSESDVKILEPEVFSKGALFSPSTGIIDSHAFMLALLGDAESNGAMLAVQSKVITAEVRENDILLKVAVKDFGIFNDCFEEISAKIVINSAGLSAPRLARNFMGMPKEKIPRDFLCKGSYFILNEKSPFKHLIYPVPNSAGLGVHVTLDLGGQARFGPDTEWIDDINYDVDMKRADSFYKSIRNYWPLLKDNALLPGYVGIRPKIVGPNDSASDFMIQTSKTHGVPGLINLFGIESPGLTASLAIADYVHEIALAEVK